MNVSTIDHKALHIAVRRAKVSDWLYRKRWFGLFVVLPTLVAAIYYALVASPVFVSQSSFVIKSPGQRPSPSLSLANLVQATGLSSGQEQTKEILQYMRSRNALLDLDRQIDIETRYAERGADFLSRYPEPFDDRSFENLYEYYGSMVGATLNTESGMAQLEVKAFTPKDAFEINSRLLDLGEVLVNRLNQRAESRAIAEARARVTQAEERLRNARVALGAFRNQQEIIDPKGQAAGVLEVSNELEAQHAALKAQLELMQRVAPLNPALPSLRNQANALGRQIAAQTGRAVGTPTGIASKLAAFEKLNVEQEFATQVLTAANTALEQARAEAQKQQYYLERVVEPNLPDQATLPKGLKNVLIVFAAVLCLYFIGWMLVVGILEHSPED